MSKITPDSPLGKKLIAQGILKPADFAGGDHVREAAKMIQKPAKPRKYHNQPVEAEGQRFDSKHEYECWKRLVAQYGAKNVIRQVSIPIGELRIRPDFMVIVQSPGIDGRVLMVRFYDAKGFVTPKWQSQTNHLRDKHGIEITLL